MVVVCVLLFVDWMIEVLILVIAQVNRLLIVEVLVMLIMMPLLNLIEVVLSMLIEVRIGRGICNWMLLRL